MVHGRHLRLNCGSPGRGRRLLWAESPLASQNGSALFIAIAVMAILLISVVVAFATSVTSLQGSNTDRAAKRALAAAEAGENLAIYRLNKITTTDLLPCVIGSGPDLVLAPLGADGWCPAVTGSVDGASYSYRVSPIANLTDLNLQNILDRKIVSTGTVGGKTRRIETTADALTGNPLFGNAFVKSNKDLPFGGNSTLVGPTGLKTKAASNGNVTISNTATVCADVTAGPGKTVTGNTSCAGTKSSASTLFTLTPVDQGTVATVNANGRFFQPGVLSGDTKTGTPSWNAGTRQLTLNGSDTVTMGASGSTGFDYSFCKLTMTGNSRLIVAAGAKVRIFFDSPQACGPLPSGTKQINMEGTSTLTTTTQDPTALQIFMVGSPTSATVADFGGTSNIPETFTLYAPYSSVILRGNTNMVGAISADQVSFDGNAKLTSGTGVGDIVADLVELYKRTKFVECTPTATGSAPDSGC